jgi:hypothetical protein
MLTDAPNPVLPESTESADLGTLDNSTRLLRRADQVIQQAKEEVRRTRMLLASLHEDQELETASRKRT